MQKPSKLKALHKLKNNSWSEFIKVFNEVHNSYLTSSVGTVMVKIDE